MAEAKFFEEAGEGRLYGGGSGTSTDPLRNCPVARANGPTARDRVDTAYLLKYDGLPFFQWYGRKSDGCFHPFGKLLRLNWAGYEALLRAEAEEPDYAKRYTAELRERILKDDPQLKPA